MMELTAALFGYLLGSIPFGLVLSKLLGYGDIRKIGSGNIGATNVLRTGNKKLALAVLLLDGGKGAAAVLLAKAALTYDVAMIAGFFALIGHCFPVWLKFKGGKGVATALGVLLAAVPYTGLAACALWLTTFFFTRISSASALSALAAAPIVTLLIYGLAPAAIVLLIAALVFFRHKDNIRRLLTGDEPRIGRKK